MLYAKDKKKQYCAYKRKSIYVFHFYTCFSIMNVLLLVINYMLWYAVLNISLIRIIWAEIQNKLLLFIYDFTDIRYLCLTLDIFVWHYIYLIDIRYLWLILDIFGYPWIIKQIYNLKYTLQPIFPFCIFLLRRNIYFRKKKFSKTS